MLTEMTAVTKIQIELICKTCKHKERHHAMNQTLLVYVLATVSSTAIKPTLLSKVGGSIVLQSVSSEILNSVVRCLGVTVAGPLLTKTAVQMGPLVLAPIFGALSRSMIVGIGRKAQMLSSH